jgi:glycosyltransferase involved in cell wall biosynthesis
MGPKEISQLHELCESRPLPIYKIADAGNVDLVGALNFGIDQCSADLSARMDQDDIMFPERLETQVHFMGKHPEISLVGASVEIIDTNGIHLAIQDYPQTHIEIVKQLKFGNCFAHPVVMYRKSALKEVGLYDPLFTQAEDFAMYMKFSKSFRCANLPDVLLKYRISASQTSQKENSVQKLSTRAIIISDTTSSLLSVRHLKLPSSNEELGDWVKSVNSYVRSHYLARNKYERESARKILGAISRSHIALARSSGYPGNRQTQTILRELGLAFLFGPFITTKWVLLNFVRV